VSAPDLAPGVATRLAAAQILHSVFKTKRSLDECFAVHEGVSELPLVDQGFARAMVTEALRQGGRLEAGFAGFVSRPLDQVGPDVRALLWLGTTQLWLLDTPPHAAVGETVAAAKAWHQTRKACGLVNAVLRRAADDRTAFDAAPPETVWPDWARLEFEPSIGAEDMRALAEAQMDRPRLHLTSTEPEQTAKALDGEIIAPGSVAVESGRVDTLEGFAEGTWWVQDAAAALAAWILAPREGELVFDLCAAPGGKTLQLAAAGARVVALDRSKKRLERLRENLARTGLVERVEVVQADVESWTPPERADAVLLDAPCSALGTLRRHPEGAWIKSQKEIQGYPAVQAAFLRVAAAMLKPGARLIYCVCTPRQEEGRDLVDAVCREGLLQRQPIEPEECGGFDGCITQQGDALTVPRGGARHDAFFISRLVSPSD